MQNLTTVTSAVPEIWLVPTKIKMVNATFQEWFVIRGLTVHFLRSTSLPNLKFLSPPTTKIWKAINVENGVVWGT